VEHIIKCHDLSAVNFVRGENCYLYDQQGKQYQDLEAGCWSASLGYAHPRINQVMKEQIDQVIHLGTRYPNAITEGAAQDVLALCGMGDGKAVFLSSGSEAVEFGVQAIRRISGRPFLLTFSSSYLAAFGSAGQKRSEEWILLDWTQCARQGNYACLETVPFEQIGGFVFEPGGSGSESVKFPEVELVQEIARRVKQQGGLLMANEITAGMGRTGKWFGFQHYDFEPDLVALGKGLGNGYPVSALVMKRHAAEKLEASDFHYAQSHQNDPLGCRVAREVIRLMREENWIERGNTTGRYFLDKLNGLAKKYPMIREARGRGMLLALEFYARPDFSTSQVYQALFEAGFLVAHSPARNFLRFDPCLTLESEAVDRFIASLDLILEDLSMSFGS
jgi:acetylornithine aminotransferase